MHLSVAICDDNESDLETARILIEDWGRKHSHSIDTVAFPQTDLLLSWLEDKKGCFDLYLLDIEMRESNEGMAFARLLRSKNDMTPIVLVTRHRDFVFGAYDVSALHYVIKPLTESKLENALRYFETSLSQRNEQFYIYTNEHGVQRLPLHQINYLAKDGHYIYINGEETMRFRSTLENAVAGYGEALLICHKSFAVNTLHVISFSIRDHYVELSDRTRIDLGRKYMDAIRELFSRD